MKLILLFLLTVITANYTFAQWSINPNVNIKVCDIQQKQFMPKITLTADGSFYVTWIDGRTDNNLKLYIQRYNSAGVAQLSENGILVNNKSQNKWINDYDLTNDGVNAIIVYSDKRAATGTDTTVIPYIYKISPQGEFIWNSDGIALSSLTTSYQSSPKVTILSDGNILTLWTSRNNVTKTTSLMFQKLNSAGTFLFSNQVNINPDNGKSFFYPSIVPTSSGAFFVTYVIGPKDTINGTYFNSEIRCAKYNNAGTLTWYETVCGFSNIFNDMKPSSIPDKSGGVLIGFHEWNNQVLYAKVQRYSSTGARLYVNSGVNLSNRNTRDHTDPIIGITSNNYVYAWFNDYVSSFGGAGGLTGQKISPNGSIVWAPEGFSQIRNILIGVRCRAASCIALDSSIIVTYTVYYAVFPQVSQVWAFKLKYNDQLEWHKQFSNESSHKDNLSSVLSSNGMSINVWKDARGNVDSTAGGIYIQNVKGDGTLGPVNIKQVSSVILEKYSLYQNYPNPFNPETQIKFDLPTTSNVKLQVYDILGKVVDVLVNEKLNQGKYQVNFNAKNLSSGIYFYQIITQDYQAYKKMLLIK